jgi:spermidine/putrescine transport system ATP-binding protein
MTPVPQPAIELRDVSKRFGNVAVLQSVTIQANEGEFFALLGPSGCGKTTSLRIMCGLENPDSGRVILRGADVTETPPNKRNVNMVFQNYELFPHMDVFANVAYGLRIRGVSRSEIADRVHQMLGVVRIQGLERRGIRQLSGGQQQRVALARALVNRPAVLLLDEPLSALDVKLRKQMQEELKRIQSELGTTFVYVTHDQDEALLLSDRMAVMDQGIVRQVGPPRELYRNPSDHFVADFVGSTNSLAFQADRVTAGAGIMDVAGGRITARIDGTDLGSPVGTLVVRPERVTLCPPTEDAVSPLDTRLVGRIVQVVYLGASLSIVVETIAGRVSAVRLDDGIRPIPHEGEDVVVTWRADDAHVVSDPSNADRAPESGGEPGD